LTVEAQLDELDTAKVDKAGGAMDAGTDYTARRVRNVIFGTVEPTTEGSDGDIYIRYTA